MFPFHLKVVPEYERAVIFRLGRLKDREAKGPGKELKEGLPFYNFFSFRHFLHLALH